MEIRHLSQISSNSGLVEFLPARPATMFFMYCSLSGSIFFRLDLDHLQVDSCIICRPKTHALARATYRLRSVFVSLPGNLVMARSGDGNGYGDGPVTAWGPEVDDCIHVSLDIMLQRSSRMESTSLPFCEKTSICDRHCLSSVEARSFFPFKWSWFWEFQHITKSITGCITAWLPEMCVVIEADDLVSSR